MSDSKPFGKPHETTSSHAAPLAERLLAQCLLQPVQDHAAFLSDLCEANPSVADDLRALWERYQALQSSGLFTGSYGDQLGDFRILSRIGEGGMGVVYLAEQVSLARRVALKVIRAELTLSDASKERFRRESRAIANLSHPSIVPVYAYGEADGMAYLAMEWIEGKSLGEALMALQSEDTNSVDARSLGHIIGANTNTSTAPPLFRGTWPDCCAEIGLRIAEALELAHGKGIVHRDVKPSNIMIARDGRVLLLDFGLAMTKDEFRLTRSGVQPGSLTYMAPEQVSPNATHAVDATSDIYSLGVTLFESLTFAPPFQDKSPARLIRKIMESDVPRIRGQRISCPRDLEAIVATTLEKSPTRRFRTAASLAEDLRRFIHRKPVLARRSGTFVRMARRVARRPATVAWIIASAAAALLAYGSVSSWLQDRSTERRQQVDRALEAGFATMGSDDVETSLQHFRRALATDPSSKIAKTGLALELRWRDGAAGAPAMDTGATSLPIYRAMSLRPQVRLGKQSAIEESIRVLERAQHSSNPPRSLYDLALAHTLCCAIGPSFAAKRRQVASILKARWAHKPRARMLAAALSPDLGAAALDTGTFPHSQLESIAKVRLADDHLETALDLVEHVRPQGVAHTLLSARALLARGRAEDANARLASIEDRFRGVAWHDVRGLCCIAQGDGAGAKQSFSRALELAPAHPATWQRLAQLHYDNKEFAEAVSAIQRALALSDSDAGRVLAAKISLARFRYREARSALEVVLKRSKKHIEARVLFASCLFSLRKWRAALREYVSAVGLGTTSSSILAHAAFSAARYGEHERARKWIDDIPDRAAASQDLATAVALGSALRLMGDKKAALALLERARIDHENAPEVEAAYAYALASVSRLDEGIEVADRLVEDHPGDERWRYVAAELFASNREFDRALKKVLEQTIGEPDRERSVVRVSRFMYSARRYQDVIDLLEREISRGIDSARVRYRLARAYRQRWQKLPNNPAHPRRATRADVAIALSHYEASARMDPDSLLARFRVAACLRSLCFFQEARAVLSEIRNSPYEVEDFAKTHKLSEWVSEELERCDSDEAYEQSTGRWLQVLTIGLARSFAKAGQHRLAAGTWLDLWGTAEYAFEAPEGMDYLFEAARDCIVAASKGSLDADKLAIVRSHAIEWFEFRLEIVGPLMISTKRRSLLAKHLRRWRDAAEFDMVRGERLADLPDDIAARWQSAWAELDRLLALPRNRSGKDK